MYYCTTVLWHSRLHSLSFPLKGSLPREHAVFHNVGEVAPGGAEAYIVLPQPPHAILAALVGFPTSCLSPRPSSVCYQARALRWWSPSSSATGVRVCTCLAWMVHPLGSRRWIPYRCAPNNPSVLPAPRTCPPVRKGLLYSSIPFTKAHSTASESTKRRSFVPLTDSSMACRASTGAKSSTMEIRFCLVSQVSTVRFSSCSLK